MVDLNCVTQVMDWLSAEITWRLHRFFDEAQAPPEPDWPRDACQATFAPLLEGVPLDRDLSVLLALAAAPHVSPEVLDGFNVKNQTLDRRFTEFGGIEVHGQFMPTRQTALFLVCGTDLHARAALARYLHPQSDLARAGVFAPGQDGPVETELLQRHTLSAEAVSLLQTGRVHIPPLSTQFPAEELTTQLDWDDLVLPASTRQRVDEILSWARFRSVLLKDWDLGARVKPGFAALFHGPPGTGKTLTASLLGKGAGIPVFRVDLSLIASKWIGETEKNIAALFDRAQSNDWILLFDEADALFGKRTDIRSGNDRFQNQQVALLLQRIESFDGITILASNLRGNIDKAFARRFQSIVHFDTPGVIERLRLWQSAFAAPVRLSADVSLPDIAAEFELTGAGIMNVLRHASLAALSKGDDEIGAPDIKAGIMRELQKEGSFV